MSISVEARDHGISALLIDLADAEVGIRDRVIDVYQQVGPTIVRTARRIVPVDTGSLQRSIWFKTNRQKLQLRVGPMLDSPDRQGGDKNVLKYARFVHDGTSRMPPRPFITQAVKRHTTPQGNLHRGMRKAGVANLGRSTGGSRL